MKFLIKLLSLFSIHSYSTGIKEKVLICIDEEKYIKKDITRSDYIFGYIFNNKSANYYYNAVLDSVNSVVEKLESKVDEVSGTDDTIKFEEEKEYKTFSDIFGVGK